MEVLYIEGDIMTKYTKLTKQPECDIIDRGYHFRGWYIKESKLDILFEVTLKKKMIKQMLFPACNLNKIRMYISRIVDSEIQK